MRHPACIGRPCFPCPGTSRLSRLSTILASRAAPQGASPGVAHPSDHLGSEAGSDPLDVPERVRESSCHREDAKSAKGTGHEKTSRSSRSLSWWSTRCSTCTVLRGPACGNRRIRRAWPRERRCVGYRFPWRSWHLRGETFLAPAPSATCEWIQFKLSRLLDTVSWRCQPPAAETIPER
jgi:hypothetical protein